MSGLPNSPKATDRSLEDKQRSGRPSTIDDETLKLLVKADPHQTTSELASQLCCDPSTVANHLHAMGKVRKLDHHEVPLFGRIITCDEKWILWDNRRRSYSWTDPGEPSQKLARKDLHPQKTLLCVWWGRFGMIHYELLKRGETITADVYCAQLQTVHEKLQKSQSALVNHKKVLVLQDNARPHVAKTTQKN